MSLFSSQIDNGTRIIRKRTQTKKMKSTSNKNYSQPKSMIPQQGVVDQSYMKQIVRFVFLNAAVTQSHY